MTVGIDSKGFLVPEREESLAPLLTALRDLVAWLQATHVAGVVIGGVAASLLGRPRVTRDVDAVVLLDESNWGAFLAAGAQFGCVPRLSDALAFAQKARVLLVRHESSGIDVDVAFGALLFEKEAIARTMWNQSSFANPRRSDRHDGYCAPSAGCTRYRVCHGRSPQVEPAPNTSMGAGVLSRLRRARNLAGSERHSGSATEAEEMKKRVTKSKILSISMLSF